MPAEIDNDGNVKANCECGKPLTNVNKYGMFCDDMCGYEESKETDETVTKIIHMLNGTFGL